MGKTLTVNSDNIEKELKMMELTEEQKNIVKTVYDEEPVIKINAYAGTGKTTTLVEIVKEIRKVDPRSRVLYLVFNRMMAKQASTKFTGLNVECYTAHAFAIKRMALLGEHVNVIDGSKFTNEFFNLKQENFRYKYASYKKFKLLMETYTASAMEMPEFIKTVRREGIDREKFKDLDLEFFETLYNKLLREHKYTHGMYLKEYARNYNDVIRDYDYVLLDEAQDLNPFMMDIIKRIKRKKLYVVGDNYQQIYAWNNAVNSMQKYDGDLYPLSKSFRFNDEIRKIADLILRFQDSYRESNNRITNVHNETRYDENKVTILFRTNSAMLEEAIEIVTSDEDKIKVHFMDIINGGEADSFEKTFSEMLQFTKVLLEDCYGDKSKIYIEFNKKFPVKVTSKMIKAYKRIATEENYPSLYDYLVENHDSLPLEYLRYWAIFRMLAYDIVDVFEKVRKAELITDFEKEYTLCTAHRAKGLEWEYVVIAPDAWKIGNLDEINLLYVACTRAMRKLDYSGIANTLTYIKEKIDEKESDDTLFDCDDGPSEETLRYLEELG